ENGISGKSGVENKQLRTKKFTKKLFSDSLLDKGSILIIRDIVILTIRISRLKKYQMIFMKMNTEHTS
ncbi:MAG: hypothetical protein KAR32_12690, partial [Candidatus Omnitrophica bacterium]|nr:hypothetical protein [Candidatus Omnitrophota bacterium]